MPPFPNPQTPSSSAFVVDPAISFETQQEGEKAVLLLRAHLITQVPWILLVFLMLFVPPLVSAALSILSVNVGAFLTGRAVLVLFLFWYLFTFGFAFEQFIKWFFNIYLLTSERIVDFDFYGVLYKGISDARLSQIEDVSAKTLGAIPTFFNYGNVLVQTAAEQNEFEFERVPDPDAVVKIIAKATQGEEEEQEAKGVVT